MGYFIFLMYTQIVISFCVIYRIMGETVIYKEKE